MTAIPVGVSVILVAVVALLLPHHATSISDREYIYDQLGQIKELTQQVDDQNGDIREKHPDNLQLDGYASTLAKSYGACESIKDRLATANKDTMADYKDAMNKVRAFCNDYEDVTDYARRVSGAIKQLVTYQSKNVETNSSTAVDEILEITDYTSTDLNRLDGNPVQDPALEELLIDVQNLQKAATLAKNNPTQTNLTNLKAELEKQQANLLNARLYFWRNTVYIDKLKPSIVRLQKDFE